MSVSTDWAEGQSRGEIGARLNASVRQNRNWSLAGLNERLFAKLFTGLVYAQIWEDPEIDMEAMQLGPGHRVVTIASGGCNALSYLTSDPARVEAVDLNPAHVAFNRLKLAALKALPDHDAFFRFVGQANAADNISTYDQTLRPLLDETTRAHWDGRNLAGRRRISIFARNVYRHGLLGRFISAGHMVSRMHGVDPSRIIKARSLDEQRQIFETELAPLFERGLIRFLTARKSTLFGLGIPPQQYEALAGGQGMAGVLRKRLEKLTCDFPIGENYFAWQAFGRGYDRAGPLPPYLQAQNYEAVKARADRYTIINASYTELLASKPAASVDRFILLDAQDWMNDWQLNDLWREITRTAAPRARVIFRTAADERLLPGRVEPATLERWHYREGESIHLHSRDRSAIYGAFHLYVLKDARL